MRGKRPARAEVPDKTPHLFTSPRHAGGGSEQLSAISGFAVTNQREMPHRRHRAALGQTDAAVSFSGVATLRNDFAAAALFVGPRTGPEPTQLEMAQACRLLGNPLNET